MNPLTAVQRVLGATLSAFYAVIPSYGVAIILLTICVGILLFPLTLKQTRSMRAMQAIQPEVKRLQAELKGDRAELNQRLQALYAERGVNPAAGCLPLLVQLPIWISLFRVLRQSAGAAGTTSSVIPAGKLADALAAGHSYFLGMDLLMSPAQAAADGLMRAGPYLVLVALVVTAGYYQQRQTARTRSASGLKTRDPRLPMGTVMKAMPVFFGLIAWSFPSGLVLYYAASSLFRIGQQGFILRLDEEREQAAEESGDKGEARPQPAKRPSPAAGKKRRHRRR